MSSLLISQPDSIQRRRSPWVWVGLCAWIVVIGAGWGSLTSYANRPGETGAAPAFVSQPATSSPRKCRLLMFVHPHCPCTAASMSELARVMSRCSHVIDATVYFFRPDRETDDWVNGNLWESASAIPGVHAEIDQRGQTASRFGSTTSGDVLLYDVSGHLRFHGGITAARGHEGDSQGKSAVMAIARGQSGKVDSTPVFGCVFRKQVKSNGK